MWLSSGFEVLSSVALLAERAVAWEFVDAEQLDKAIKTNEHSLIGFVDLSVDACKALEPEWDLVSGAAKDATTLVIDCAANPDYCAEHDVSSYPSIRLYYDDGSFERYRGPKKAKQIIPFLNRCLRPILSELDPGNLTSFLSIDHIVFIAHLVPSESTFLFDRFDAIAEKYRDRYSFGWAPLAKPPSGVGCYNNLDNAQYAVGAAELDVSVDALEKFVKKCTAQLVPELTRRNELEYLNAGKSLVYYFLTTDAQRETYRNMIRPLARKYQEYLTFVLVDANEYPEMLPMVGLEEDDTPAIAVQNPSNGQVFPYDGDAPIGPEVVERFVLDIVEGIVKPWDGPKHREAGHTTAAHDEL